MITIRRGPAPKFFQHKRMLDAITELNKMAVNVVRQERLKFDQSLLDEITEDLNIVCNGKCAYCESRLTQVSAMSVESFRPKSGAKGLTSSSYAPTHYWWLAYAWENMLMACEICNQKYKRDFFPVEDEGKRAPIGATGEELIKENALLIDPAFDNPAEHLAFEESGMIRPLTTKGKVTVDIIGLNREELVSRRKQAAQNLLHRLETLKDARDFKGRLIQELVAFVRELYSETPSQEFVALQRTVFDTWYERNATLWEEVKSIHNDRSQKHQGPTKRMVDAGYEENIQAVSMQLSALKRFSIKSILIENFRSIDKLELNILSLNEKESRESWLLLLGDNGIGKSSILQAIALALSSKKQLDKLDLDVKDFLRRGQTQGRVSIQSYEHDKPVELRFDVHGFHTDLHEALCFTMAYGSTRLLPKGNISPDHNKEPYLNIRNLFDYSVSLNDPQQWLNTVDVREFNDRVASAFFDLLALRGGDQISLHGDKLTIRQYGEEHDLEDNSDGYKSVLALAGDMMQTLSIESANYHNSYGIVLIDELGNHLHPRWRMKIVSALRRAFPKLQFIVTTHEPLCLRGLSHGEVVVLVRDEQNRIRALDSKYLPDHSILRIDQLLTSDLFGLINVLDDETEKTYEQYYALLSKNETDRTEEEKSKIEVYSATLANKEMLGSSPQVQAMFKMFNENYAQLKKEGFKTKEQLKVETINNVKDLLKKKNLNWLDDDQN